MIVAEHDVQRLPPGNLLDTAHLPHQFWTPIIAALEAQGFEPWAMWAWLESPTSFLTGETPLTSSARTPVAFGWPSTATC